MSSNFFSMILRMKYINRWGLMRNTRNENISEHSLDVAMIAHGIAVIAKKRLGISVNPEKAALLALFHDVSEIITGDIPTPIKYYDKNIINAYKGIEEIANSNILAMLPHDLQDEYSSIFIKDSADDYEWEIVKAADKISAYIKCLEEKQLGNKDFDKARVSILKFINALNMKEVDMFMEEFIEGFSLTIDEQNADHY